MKYILLSALIVGFSACSPSSTAEPQNVEASPVMPKVGNWTVVPSDSHIKFTATQTGDVFTGEFKVFDAVINFDPAAVEDASVTATVDIKSFEAGDEERNGALPSKDWFHIKSHPNAVFQSSNFTELEDGGYEASGTLTLKGISQPLTLPFSLDIEDGRAEMIGSVSLNRGDFKVGQGAWATDEWVSLDVSVDVKITATR